VNTLPSFSLLGHEIVPNSTADNTNRYRRKQDLIRERIDLRTLLEMLQKEAAAIKQSSDAVATARRQDVHRSIQKIQAKLANMRDELAQIHNEESEVAKGILKELLGQARYEMLRDEVIRRQRGLSPSRIDIFRSTATATAIDYRDLASTLLAELVAARKALTGCLEAGSKKSEDPGAFLRLFSDANRALRPVNDYDKLKRLHHLK
jgi:hypothetical protein